MPFMMMMAQHWLSQRVRKQQKQKKYTSNIKSNQIFNAILIHFSSHSVLLCSIVISPALLVCRLLRHILQINEIIDVKWVLCHSVCAKLRNHFHPFNHPQTRWRNSIFIHNSQYGSVFLPVAMSKLVYFYVVFVNFYWFFAFFFLLRIFRVELDPVTQTDDTIGHQIVIDVKVWARYRWIDIR